MSLVGRKPISVPDNTSVVIDGSRITVKGVKGELERNFDSRLQVELKNGVITVKRNGDEPSERAAHGLWRSLISNMVVGVSTGFEKRLEIIGTGYRAKKSGAGLELTLGFSHGVRVEPLGSNQLETEGANTVIVKGISREDVGEQSARIRRLRKPNPYTDKGIRYVDEVVRRKTGKTGAGAE